MHRSWSPLVLAVAILAAAARPSAAAPLLFTLEPAATQVSLGFGATLHTVDGSLRATSGSIRFDPETGDAEGEIILDMTSTSTHNSRRDRKMHAKILESGRYPRAVYRVQRISGTFRSEGTNDLLLHGALEMHGTSRPLDLPASARVEGDRVTATGKVTIPYLEWGLRDPSFFVLRVSKQVQVTVRAVGTVSPAAP